MTDDDLLKMLDLDGREPTPQGEPLAITPSDTINNQVPASPGSYSPSSASRRAGR